METVMLKDALTVIQERKSVRSYTGEPVSKEDIDKLLRAAMAAPGSYSYAAMEIYSSNG